MCLSGLDLAYVDVYGGNMRTGVMWGCRYLWEELDYQLSIYYSTQCTWAA